MRKSCKTCNREFEAKGRALYCGGECRREVDAKRKRDIYALKTYVKRNLSYYEEGIAEYLETRGEPRYLTDDDMVAEAKSQHVKRKDLALVSQGDRAWSKDSEPTSIGRSQVRVCGQDWGLTRPGCPRLTNGLGAVRGHCEACNHALTDRPVDLTQHNMSLEMDYSGLTGQALALSGDVWPPPEPEAETGEFDTTERPRPLTRADVDRIGDEHKPGCKCEECRAERAELEERAA